MRGEYDHEFGNDSWKKDILDRKYGPINRDYKHDKVALRKIFENMIIEDPALKKALSNPKAKKKVILHSPDF